MPLLSKRLAETRIRIVGPYLKGGVLDLGCGGARILREYGTLLTSYCGVERSESLVQELSQGYPQATFLCRDLDRQNLNIDRQFDTVLLLSVLEHLFNQRFIFEEILKVLKPDGKVIITTPTPLGNDIVLRAGSALGLVTPTVVNDHIVIYNRLRLNILAKEVGLKLTRYQTFEFLCNQMAILGRK